MGKIKIKKVSPKQFAGAMKSVGKALYKYTGAETMVTSGKALSKCKPKDAKCIATNLGKLALAAKNFVPGAGMAAGIASTVAKNVIKEQVQKKVKAELAKKEAQKKLKAAKTEEEKKKAAAELAKADAAIATADATIAVKEKEKADAETVVQQQAGAEKAIQAVEEAKLDPKTAEAAKIADKDIKAEIKNVPSDAAVKAASGGGDSTPAATGKASNAIKIILAILGALLLFVLLGM
jgi:hypothetical protein